MCIRDRYIDAAYSKVVGGVGHKAFEMISNADKKYVDGAVNQIGKTTIRLGAMMRPLQSGYMRNYAIGITIGGLALLIWIIAGAS